VRPQDLEKGKIPPDQDFRMGNPSDFCIIVAAHPQGHPECPDKKETLMHLKEKVAQGADLIITQMVFSAEIFRDFLRDARNLGINAPIIPGVRPITKFSQIKHIESFFQVPVPDVFKNEMKALGKEEAREKGINLTLSLCRELIKSGAPGIHFYLMNDVQTGKALMESIRKGTASQA
jgi:methylenetetrahydrofolate reductase (NADPH)